MVDSWLKMSKKQVKVSTMTGKNISVRFINIHLNGGYAPAAVDIPGKKP
ncbi:MAG: hypothetical protein J6D61_01160 [Clostridia bacterium]|nr:hypothetical protein [Clostridia bacterium]